MIRMGWDLPRVIPTSRQQELIVLSEADVGYMSGVTKVLFMRGLQRERRSEEGEGKRKMRVEKGDNGHSLIGL